MAKKDKKQETPEEEVEVVTEATQETESGEQAEDKALAFAQALKEKEEQLLRLAAEYDNFRKRSQKEKEAVWTDATAKAIVTMLPVYDNLSRALAHGTQDADFLKGVEMTMNQLMKVFETLGVTKMNALGEPFNPEWHNAVMHIEDEAVGENTIVEVFEEGFFLGEKPIRFAMVKVAN